ncbi:MAG: TRAP transporter TatT component family protein [Thermodesulfobacteriota bacterium]
MIRVRTRTWILALLALTSLAPGCLPNKRLTVGAAASLLEDVAKASYRQSDLRTIRQGMPAYLLLIDGMVEAMPDNERLLIAAAQGYSSFASVFAGEEEREYAKVLASKAKDYALRALDRKGIKGDLDEFRVSVAILNKEDMDYIFWGAATWATWIGLNLDSMEAMADLPKVEILMRRALELDETFYYGGPHLFMGIWYSSRPKMAGGDLDKARWHFTRALELGQGRFLMAHVYYADLYARRIQDRDLFTSVLDEALRTPANVVPDLTLLNTVAQAKARALLDSVDDYFLD